MWLQKVHRNRKSFLLFAVLALLLIITLFKDHSQIVINLKEDRDAITCKRPNLPVDAPDIMQFVKDVPPINCTKAPPDWVVCENSTCTITEDAKKQYAPVTCNFTDILRVNDTHVMDGRSLEVNSSYLLKKSDFVRVNCTGGINGTNTWISILTAIRQDKVLIENATWENVPEDGFQVNVLMLGFDSLSRNTFIRKLPKSYTYMTEVLGTKVLNGYNIVGDGTPQALTPILTGKTELELPDVRKRMKNTSFVDVYPFIWKDFNDVGYATAYFEDAPDTGVYTYRLNGFKEQPTDHYMRTYYVAINEFIKEWPPLCSGSVPRHKVLFNQIKNFYNVYANSPRFLFAFHGEVSHDDYNLVGAVDEDLLAFLQDINKSGLLNNTILIMMADHGHRFADIRNTIQGKLEERLPFFSYTFPPNFKENFPSIYEIFVNNLNKLCTPFDIHATFQSMLQYVDIILKPSRSISLFNKVPPSRTCADAFIEPHWCTCLDWINITLDNQVVPKLQKTLEDTLNEFTEGHRKMCAKLHVSKIYYVTKMRPNEDLIKFSKAADYDGFVPDLSAKTKVNSNIYQIKASVTPGDSIFEASITHFLDSGKFKLEIKDISRINMYGSQAKCVQDDLPDLRKYCYCI